MAKINISGLEVEVLRSPASGSDLPLSSSTEIEFTDTNHDAASPTWTATGVKFSSISEEWDTWKSSFGEVSLMSAVITASTSGGGSPPGGSDTQVQFNQNGAFAGNANLTFNPTGSIASDAKLFLNGVFLAHRAATGGLQTDEKWTKLAAGSTKVLAYESGSFAQGYVHPSNTSYGISAYNNGSFAQGYADASNGYIQASLGSLAQGRVTNDGTIVAGNYGSSKGGSFAQGFVNKGTIFAGSATKAGQLAQGYVRRNGKIQSLGNGTFAQGYCDGNNTNQGYIKSDGYGTFAQGYAGNYVAKIEALSRGSFAQGSAETSGLIQALSAGSFAQGAARGGRTIVAKWKGSLAQGYAYLGSDVLAYGEGSLAQGYAKGAATLVARDGSFTQGFARTTGTIGAQNNNVKGAFAQGYVTFVGSIGSHRTIDFGAYASDGAFAQGFARSSGSIESNAGGTFAQGAAVVSSSIIASSRGAMAQGFVSGVVGTVSAISASGPGTFAQGTVLGAGAIRASSTGSFARGFVWERGSGYASVIESKANGSFVQGWSSGLTTGSGISYVAAASTATGGFVHGSALYRGYIYASLPGQVAQGVTIGSSDGQYHAKISPGGRGAFAQGYVKATAAHARMLATAGGSFVQGLVRDSANPGGGGSLSPPAAGSPNNIGPTVIMRAAGSGSFAQGAVVGHGSDLQAADHGSFAQGVVSGVTSSIYAGGAGSVARGLVAGNYSYLKTAGVGSFAHGAIQNKNNALIYAYGAGSVAMGNAANGDIYAYAAHSFQFGPGRNDHASSFQIGDVTSSSGIGIRISSAKPATTGNGDLFLESNRLTTAGTFASSGSIEAVLGLSGSLTQLVDGTSYLIAGSNITIASSSNGAVTISSTAGGGTPGGSDTQVQFNQSSAFAGSANLLFDVTGSTGGAGLLSLTGSLQQFPASGQLGAWEQHVTGTTITSATVSGSFGNLTLGANTVYKLTADVVGRSSTGGEYGAFTISAMAFRAAGNATLGAVGTQADFTDVSTGSWVAGFATSGNDVTIAVTGSISNDTNWFSTLKATRVI